MAAVPAWRATATSGSSSSSDRGCAAAISSTSSTGRAASAARPASLATSSPIANRRGTLAAPPARRRAGLTVYNEALRVEQPGPASKSPVQRRNLDGVHLFQHRTEALHRRGHLVILACYGLVGERQRTY